MKHLGINEIKEILPHRHPFLLVDYIEDYEPGEYAVGYKCVTYREDFFAGHFPQEPVMPGVLIIEALAQVGAVAVLMQEENKGKLGYFFYHFQTTIQNHTFKNYSYISIDRIRIQEYFINCIIIPPLTNSIYPPHKKTNLHFSP